MDVVDFDEEPRRRPEEIPIILQQEMKITTKVSKITGITKD